MNLWENIVAVTLVTHGSDHAVLKKPGTQDTIINGCINNKIIKYKV